MELFDLHCDTITTCFDQKKELYENDLGISLRGGSGFARWAQLFAIWMPDIYRGEEAAQYFESRAAFFFEQVKKNAAHVAHCRDMEEAEKAFAEGRCAAFLTVEGGSALLGDIRRVDMLKSLGVSLITLTWNGENELGGGADTHTGLTDVGKKIIKRMEEVGILADVSHLCDESFADFLEVAEKPFVASHSCSRAICPHRRNLTDAQFIAIQERQGLVGINFYVNFLSDKKAGLTDVVRHADHFLSLGGEKCLALGSDYDGAKMPQRIVKQQKLGALYECMLRHGYKEDLVRDIFFRNAQAFFVKHTGRNEN